MDTSSGESLFAFYIIFSSLTGESRFLYDKQDASFMDLPLPLNTHAALEPPHNCPICARREEEEIQTCGRVIREAGAVIGVAVHGATFHVADFAFLRAEQGPTRIGQLVEIYSGRSIWVKVQLLGRVLDLVDFLQADKLRDEVCLSFVPLPLDPNLSSSSVSVTCSSQTRRKMCP